MRFDGAASETIPAMTRLGHPDRGAVAALAAAFLVYLVAGHAYHPGKTMDEAAVGSGICIVLVTVLATVTLRRPQRRPALLVRRITRLRRSTAR